MIYFMRFASSLSCRDNSGPGGWTAPSHDRQILRGLACHSISRRLQAGRAATCILAARGKSPRFSIWCTWQCHRLSHSPGAQNRSCKSIGSPAHSLTITKHKLRIHQIANIQRRACACHTCAHMLTHIGSRACACHDVGPCDAGIRQSHCCPCVKSQREQPSWSGKRHQVSQAPSKTRADHACALLLLSAVQVHHDQLLSTSGCKVP